MILTMLGQLSDMHKDELDYDTLKEFTKLSNIAAALTITKKGALDSIPSREDAIQFIK